MTWVVLWIVCALAAAGAAEKKGNSVIMGFLAGFLLGPIGVIIEVFHPAPKESKKKGAPDSTTMSCPRCAEQVQRSAVVCRWCGHEFRAAARRRSGAISEFSRPPGASVPSHEAPPRSRVSADAGCEQIVEGTTLGVPATQYRHPELARIASSFPTNFDRICEVFESQAQVGRVGDAVSVEDACLRHSGGESVERAVLGALQAQEIREASASRRSEPG